MDTKSNILHIIQEKKIKPFSKKRLFIAKCIMFGVSIFGVINAVFVFGMLYAIHTTPIGQWYAISGFSNINAFIDILSLSSLIFLATSSCLGIYISLVLLREKKISLQLGGIILAVLVSLLGCVFFLPPVIRFVYMQLL